MFVVFDCFQPGFLRVGWKSDSNTADPAVRLLQVFSCSSPVLRGCSKSPVPSPAWYSAPCYIVQYHPPVRLLASPAFQNRTRLVEGSGFDRPALSTLLFRDFYIKVVTNENNAITQGTEPYRRHHVAQFPPLHRVAGGASPAPTG